MTMHNRSYMHRRRRRNPDGFAGMSTTELLWGGAGVVGNFLIARSGPAMLLPQYNVGAVGYGLNALFGAAGAWGIGKLNRQAGVGAWFGLIAALASRFIAENFGSGQAAATSGMSGDLDYYIGDPFPFAQGAGGPYQAFPGSPYLPGGAPVTSAAAVRAGAAAAAAALPAATAAAAAPGSSMASPATGNWRGSRRW
jgi:hypothetical protein